MGFIYVIRLKDDCYYVGRVNISSHENLLRRMNQHLNGAGSEWTKLHKPLLDLKGQIIFETLIETNDFFEEDMYVKKKMHEHGIDKVRGGSYSNCNLTEGQKRFINTEILNCTDGCFKCGNKGHFAKDCDTIYTESIMIPDTKIKARQTPYVDNYCAIQ